MKESLYFNFIIKFKLVFISIFLLGITSSYQVLEKKGFNNLNFFYFLLTMYSMNFSVRPTFLTVSYHSWLFRDRFWYLSCLNDQNRPWNGQKRLWNVHTVSSRIAEMLRNVRVSRSNCLITCDLTKKPKVSLWLENTLKIYSAMKQI